MRHNVEYQGKVLGAVEQLRNGTWVAYRGKQTNSFKTSHEAMAYILFESGMDAALDLSAFNTALRANAVTMAKHVEDLCKRSPTHLTEFRIALAWIWDPEYEPPQK